MRINVTQRDIDLGERGVGDACPIARAMHRHAGFEKVCVNAWEIKNGGVWYNTSPCVRDFVRSFDRGRPVAPFTFVLHTAP